MTRKVKPISQQLLDKSEALWKETGAATLQELSDAYRSMAFLAVQIEALMKMPITPITKKKGKANE